MKKLVSLFVGSLLFIAGYQQAQKQVQYAKSRASIESPAYAEKPVIVPVENTPTLAFYLSRSFVKN
ncbi:hypothetical protein [Spirosoma luteum]|uniref:hypothetical protein n=1 Tax=Spirosoma luteum TaxID=431553 RepID=UPI000363900A|nr:hypothetical protein [Spirosoma luteum]